MVHTEDCQQMIDGSTLAQREWIALWAGYCVKCSGAGVHITYESHGFKGGGREQLQDPCSHCTENGICARCGAQGLTVDGEGPCTFCKWDYDDALPQVWECYGDCNQGENDGYV